MLNSFDVIGNLTADAEYISTEKGNGFLAFTVCNHDNVAKDENGNKRVNGYFEVTYGGGNPEKFAEFLTKGRKVYVTGKLVRNPREVNGRKYENYKIRANEIGLLDYRE